MLKTLASPSGRTFRLGRKRPLALPPRMLRMASYLRRTFPAPPPTSDWTPKAMASVEEVYLNDVESDCVIACGAHWEGLWTGNATGTPIIYNNSQINQQYSAIGGYVPGDPSTDNGCDEVSALQYWQHYGFAGGTPIATFMLVNSSDPVEVRIAINEFGGVMYGAELAQAWAQNMPDKTGFTWNVAGAPDPSLGHCFLGGGFKPGFVKIIEWGLWGWISDAATAEYASSDQGGGLYTAVTEDWIIKASKESPSGFAFADLMSDLHNLGWATGQKQAYA